MDAKIVTLKSPITFGSETITEIRFERELKAKDLRGLPLTGMTVDHILEVSSRLASQPLKVINELSGEDFLAVIDAVTGFFPAGLLTGKSE